MKAVLSEVLTACSLVLLSAGHAVAGTGGGLPTSIAVVPEPTSLALIAGGVAAVAWARFRKR
jgi:hypothetical protein